MGDLDLHRIICGGGRRYDDEKLWFSRIRATAQSQCQESAGTTSAGAAQAFAFRNRLARQQDHLLGCLAEPPAEPTNNRAQRDLRPAVINRKVNCCNKTIAVKQVWKTLRDVVTTVSRNGTELIATLAPPPSLHN